MIFESHDVFVGDIKFINNFANYSDDCFYLNRCHYSIIACIHVDGDRLTMLTSILGISLDLWFADRLNVSLLS